LWAESWKLEGSKAGRFEGFKARSSKAVRLEAGSLKVLRLEDVKARGR
jgi:hypothetical protein